MTNDKLREADVRLAEVSKERDEEVMKDKPDYDKVDKLRDEQIELNNEFIKAGYESQL